jgi:hypothetical protein
MAAGKENTIENWKLYSVMVLMLITGTCNTIVMKMQDQVVVGTDSDGKDILYTHPYF